MSNIKVCACDKMPYLHHAGRDLCENENLVVFTKEEIEEQEKCQHEEVFDHVCGACGKVIILYEACSCSAEEKIHPHNVHLCDEVVPPVAATTWDVVPGWVRFQNSLVEEEK